MSTTSPQQETPKSSQSQLSPTVVGNKQKKKPNRSLNKDELLKLASELEKENSITNKDIASLHQELESQKSENQSLRDELHDIREQLEEVKVMVATPSRNDFNDRLVKVERRLYSQEQYSRRECIELHGFENVAIENVEDAAIAVCNATATADNTYKKTDFHAIHKLKNDNVVIMKAVNRRTVLNILRNRKNLKELTDTEKQPLKEKKIFLFLPSCKQGRKQLLFLFGG